MNVTKWPQRTWLDPSYRAEAGLSLQRTSHTRMWLSAVWARCREIVASPKSVTASPNQLYPVSAAGVSCCWALLNLFPRCQPAGLILLLRSLHHRSKSARVVWSGSWYCFSVKRSSSLSTASSFLSREAQSGGRMSMLVTEVLVAVLVAVVPERAATSDVVVEIATSNQGLVLPLSQTSTPRNLVRNKQSTDGEGSDCEGHLRTFWDGGGISGAARAAQGLA